MIEVTKAIVIKTIKYGDTSLIATCYTQNSGIKTYMLKGILTAKKGKIKSAYFQPLSQVILTANHNNKGALNSISDIELSSFYQSIYTDIRKQTIALFLAEVLSYSIKEEEKNEALFEYIETSLNWLDNHDDSANFHLLFLFNLTKYLGFYPELNNLNYSYFNMLDGQFSKTRNHNVIFGEDLVQFKKLFGINFDAMHTIGLNGIDRQSILASLLLYFELHLSGFKRPKSLNILKSVFS